MTTCINHNSARVACEKHALVVVVAIIIIIYYYYYYYYYYYADW